MPFHALPNPNMICQSIEGHGRALGGHWAQTRRRPNGRVELHTSIIIETSGHARQITAMI